MASGFGDDQLAQSPGSGFGDDALASHPSSWLDDVGDTVKQYWDKVNPAAQARGVADAIAHPVDAVKGYLASNQALAAKADDAFKSGNYVDAGRHALSYVLNAIPGLGSALDEAGNKSASGDYKGAIASTAALATNLLAAKLGPGALDAAARPEVGAAVSRAMAPAKAAVKAGAGDVAAGAARTAAGVALAKSGLGEIAGGITGGPMISEGAKQVGHGVSAAAAAYKQALADQAARLRVPTPAPPDVVIPPHPLEVPASPIASQTLRPAPQAETIAPSPSPGIINPYAPPASGAIAPAAERAAEAQDALTRPAPLAAPGAPEGANAVITTQEADWLKKRTADTAAKDDVLATYAQGKGVAKVEPGKPYADLVAAANKELGKKYQANIGRPEHPARVAALNDLIASKNATASAIAKASALDKAGVTLANVTPEQLGATALEQANTLFQMQKLSAGAKAAPVAAAP